MNIIYIRENYIGTSRIELFFAVSPNVALFK